MQRVPNSTLVHVSCTLSKIPYGGFSPVRLQTEAPFGQPYPARSPHVLKPQVDIHPWDHRFDKVFVFVLPSCLYGGYYQRHQPRALCTTTSVHGSFALAELCCLYPQRSYDPIRQSRRLPQTSQDAWLYYGSLPDDLIWAVPETFPAL